MKKNIILCAVASISICVFAQEILDDNEVVLESNEPKMAVSEVIDSQIVYLVEPESSDEKILPETEEKRTSQIVEKNEMQQKSSVQQSQSKAQEVKKESVEVQQLPLSASENDAYSENINAEDDQITPSHTIRAKQNQHISIEFLGTKWTYLGEESDEKITDYDGSSTKEKTTEFYVFAKKPGATILHFYKNDVIAKKYIDDYVELVIEKSSDVEKSEKNSENEKSAKSDSNDSSQTTVVLENNVQKNGEKKAYEEALDPTSFKIESKNKQPETQSETDAVLEQAQNAYDEGNFSEAKNYLDVFFGSAISNLDRGLFLQGQILEAYSPIRNIRGALRSYKNLLNSYPFSKYANDAEKRAIYLERFYFDIY